MWNKFDSYKAKWKQSILFLKPHSNKGLKFIDHIMQFVVSKTVAIFNRAVGLKLSNTTPLLWHRIYNSATCKYI